MAMKNCPECGHEMSTSAEACPNCGWQPVSERHEPERTVYVVDPPEEKSGCSVGTVIIGLLVGLGIFALLVWIFYPYYYGGQPPQSNTVNVNISVEAQNKQTTEIIITTPEPREPPTPRPTEPPPTPRPTPEKPTPAPRPTTPTRGNGNTR